MAWADYWRVIVNVNPPLATESTRLTLPVAEFKRHLERAYNAGRRDELESIRAEAAPRGGVDFLRDLLGGGR